MNFAIDGMVISNIRLRENDISEDTTLVIRQSPQDDSMK